MSTALPKGARIRRSKITTSTPTSSEEKTTTAFPTLEGTLSRFGDFGDAAIRFAAGAFLVPHGAQKLFGWFGGHDLEATGQFFGAQLGFANGYLVLLVLALLSFLRVPPWLLASLLALQPSPLP